MLNFDRSTVKRGTQNIQNDCFLTALERTKFVYGRGSDPNPTGGAHGAPPGLLAGLRGPTSKERGEEGKGNGYGWERKGREWEVTQIPGSAPVNRIK